MATVEEDRQVTPGVKNEPNSVDAHHNNDHPTSESLPDGKLENPESQPDNDVSNSEKQPNKALHTSENQATIEEANVDASPKQELAHSGEPPSSQSVDSESLPSNHPGPGNSEAQPSNELAHSEALATSQLATPEAPPNYQLDHSEAPLSNGLANSEAQPSNEVVISETQTVDQVVMSETLPSNETVMSETQPCNEMTMPETQPANEMAMSEVQPGNEVVMPETQPGNEAVMPETQPGNEAVMPETQLGNEAVMPETQPGNEAVMPETQPGSEGVAPETQNVNEALMPETQSGNEAVIPETQPSNEVEQGFELTHSSNEVVISNTQPNNDVVMSETQPSNEVVTCETQTSGDVIMSEANSIQHPGNQFSHPETLPDSQFTDFHMIHENQMPLPESLPNSEPEPPQIDHPTEMKPMHDNNMVHYETLPSDHLAHSESMANHQLENPEMMSHDQLASSQMLSHYELSNSETVNNNQLAISESHYELVNSETPPSYEIIDASTQPNNEEHTPETQPNKRRKKKSIVWEHFTIETVSAGCRRACCKQCKQSFAYSTGSKVAGTSHLKRHIAKGTCPALLRNQQQNHDWKLQKRILNVVMEPYPDSDTALSHAIAVCLSDWSLEGRVFSITSNQALNGVAPENLRPLLSVKNPLILNGQLVLGNCIARTLSSVANGLLESSHDLVKKIRNSVKYVKTSESHEEKFLELKQQLQVPSDRSLFIDDQTQWSTTYQMLVAASELKEVFCCLDTSDPDYKGAPSMQDWKLVETLCTYLKPIFDAANILTTTIYPSAITFFHEVWKLQLDLARAVMMVMDPRFKMKLVEFSFSKIYGDDAHVYIKIVDDGVHELFNEYMALPLPLTPAYAEEGNAGNHMKTEESPGGMLSDSGLTDFDVYIMETSSQQMKSELDQYLEESLLPRVPDFDVLGWWKLNRVKYPTLSKMARDILCVPVSTVPADSVFDTKSKEMDQYRSSLRPETVEALVCAKDWMQHGSAETTNAAVKMQF
ncbi:hypothetical protein K1719_011685 [Acacia pycnantha]|nr:hypothetical protein K1719_011685 [Acacia pycnantha]